MKVIDILSEAGMSMDDVKAMLGKERDGVNQQNADFTKTRDSLSRKDIAFLSHVVKRKQNKKGTNIPDDILGKLSDLGLTDPKGKLSDTAIPFLRWVSKNPSKEMDFIDKRSDANDALSRGHMKRDNEWTNPLQKRARKLIKRLSDDDLDVFRKVYNRFINRRTRNLANSWGDVPVKDVTRLRKYGILDNDSNLTEFGEFAVQYYMTFKDDPDGMDRVSKSQRVGNYGTAQRRRQGRADKLTNK